MKNLFRLLIPLTIVVFIFIYYKEGNLPVNSQNKAEKLFVIPRGTPVKDVIKSLYNENLIRNELIFYLIIKQRGIDQKIQAGDFRLSESMSAEKIADTLTKGSLDSWVTIVEGLRKEEIAQILAEKVGISAIEFINIAREGYLFPDTYLIPKGTSTQYVIDIFTRNFNAKFTPQLKLQAQTKNLSELQVLTLASLVEREAKTHTSRVNVASIMLKRLENDWPLQVDATVQYAIGYQTASHSWWKKNLTQQDIAIDSEYNTYKYKGLPPGPIGNPGMSSITAVIEANPNTPYWFYLTGNNGQMYYAKTIEEHNTYKSNYINR